MKPAAGHIWKQRSVLARLPKPVLELGSAARWAGWQTAGRPITAAAAASTLVVAWAGSPLAVTAAAITTAATIASDRIWNITLAAPPLLILAALWHLTETNPAAVALTAALTATAVPADYLIGRAHPEYRTWQLYCVAFRRRAPETYSQVAGKSTKVQGAVGEENQVITRKYLDHPAMWVIPRIHGNTARIRVSVTPGRNFSRLDEVLDEWAAQMPEVAHIALTRVDDFASFGELAIRFGPTELPEGDTQWPPDGDGTTGGYTSFSRQTGNPFTQEKPAAHATNGGPNTPDTNAPATGGHSSTTNEQSSHT